MAARINPIPSKAIGRTSAIDFLPDIQRKRTLLYIKITERLLNGRFFLKKMVITEKLPAETLARERRTIESYFSDRYPDSLETQLAVMMIINAGFRMDETGNATLPLADLRKRVKQEKRDYSLDGTGSCLAELFCAGYNLAQSYSIMQPREFSKLLFELGCLDIALARRTLDQSAKAQIARNASMTFALLQRSGYGEKETYLKRAECAMLVEDYNGAIPFLESAEYFKVNPMLTSALLAECYYAQPDYPLAMKYALESKDHGNTHKINTRIITDCTARLGTSCLDEDI